jgi:hypothetical protein
MIRVETLTMSRVTSWFCFGRSFTVVILAVRLLSSVFWVMNPSDAPYPVVGHFLGDGRDTLVRFFFWREYLFREGAQPYSILSIKW